MPTTPIAPVSVRVPILLAAAGLALAPAGAFGQGDPLGEPFPAVFELASLLASEGGDGSLGYVIHANESRDRFGASVVRAGDFDGDGIDDFVVGAPHGRAGGLPSTGAAFVVFGTPHLVPPERAAEEIYGGGGVVLYGQRGPGSLPSAGGGRWPTSAISMATGSTTWPSGRTNSA